MYSTPLSPVMEESLMSQEVNCINFLQTTNAATLSDFLSEKLIKGLLKGENTLIIMPSGCDMEVPAKTLSKNKLAHLVTIWDGHNHLDAKACERFKILTRLSEVERHRNSYDNLQCYINILKGDIAKQLESYYLNVGNGKKIKDVASNYHADELMHINPTLQNSIDHIINPDEVSDHCDHLEKLYNQRFILMSADLIDSKIYNQKQTHVEARHSIQILCNFADSIKYNFDYAKNELLNEIKQDIDQESLLWSIALEKIREAYYTHDIEYGKIDFASIVQKLISEARQSKYLNLKETDLQNLTWQNGIQLIYSIETLLQSQSEILAESRQRYFKRLTPFNCKSDRLRATLNQVEELSIMLTEYDWLHITCNARSLTLNNLQDEIAQTSDKLNKVNAILSDIEFNQFKELQSRLNVSDDLVDALKSDKSKSWKVVYNNLIISNIISKKSKRGQQSLESKYQKLQTIESQKAEIIQDVIHNIWCKKRSKALADFRTAQNVLYQSLFFGNEMKVSFADLFSVASDFLLAYYPVMIIRQNELSQLDQFISKWQNIVFYDSIHISPEEVTPFIHAERSVCIATSQAINLNPIQNEWSTHLFFSKDIRLTYAQPFSLLQRSERFHQAKALSIAIHRVVDTFSIYRLRNKCIISLINDNLDARIVNALPENEFNVLYEKSNDLDDLIEAMLHPDTEVYILHENGLLNDKNVKSIEWQLHVIQLLQQAQVQMIDIDTLQLLKNYNVAFRKIIDDLTYISVSEPRSLEITL
jgi:hypothetical protein